jgi:hypothetical protein
MDFTTCAFCAKTVFGGSRENFRSIPPPSAETFQEYVQKCPALQQDKPLAIQPITACLYPHLKNYTQTPTGRWNVCPTCYDIKKTRIKRMQFHPYYPPGYVDDLISSDPLTTHLLALVDVGLAYDQPPDAMRQCFRRMRVVDTSIFDCVLVHCQAAQGSHLSYATVPRTIQRLYDVNTAMNPLYTEYVPLLDRPDAQPGLPQASTRIA